MSAKAILKTTGKWLAFGVVLFVWLIFSYATLDRSGLEPTPNPISLLALAGVIFLFFKRSILSRKLNFAGVVSRLAVALPLALGVVGYIS